MSRVFKFRAWDLDDKKYEYNIAIRPINKIIAIEIYNNEMYPVEFRGIVEQYTGLKDKNGKEIYEGDIVGIYQEYSDKEGSKTWEELEPWGQVTYEDSRARFGIWGDSLYGGEDRHFFDLVEGLEVIGNIHENPELLGGEE